jgi:hypothetical protein
LALVVYLLQWLLRARKFETGGRSRVGLNFVCVVHIGVHCMDCIAFGIGCS